MLWGNAYSQRATNALMATAYGLTNNGAEFIERNSNNF